MDNLQGSILQKIVDVDYTGVDGATAKVIVDSAADRDIEVQVKKTPRAFTVRQAGAEDIAFDGSTARTLDLTGYVKSAALDGKLDKKSPGTFSAYVVYTDGTQTTYPISKSGELQYANTLAWRDENAALYGQTAITSTGNSYVNINYLNSSISGKEDSSNKVALSSAATSAQYPTASSVWAECSNIREAAEGKCKTFITGHGYTIADLKFRIQRGMVRNVFDASGANITQAVVDGQYDSVTLINADLNSQSDSITYSVGLNSKYMIVGDATAWEYQDNPILDTLPNIKFDKGDIILIRETEVPDRWVSNWTNGLTFYKLETTKVSGGVTLDTNQTITGAKTFAADVKIDAQHSLTDGSNSVKVADIISATGRENQTISGNVEISGGFDAQGVVDLRKTGDDSFRVRGQSQFDDNIAIGESGGSTTLSLNGSAISSWSEVGGAKKYLHNVYMGMTRNNFSGSITATLVSTRAEAFANISDVLAYGTMPLDGVDTNNVVPASGVLSNISGGSTSCLYFVCGIKQGPSMMSNTLFIRYHEYDFTTGSTVGQTHSSNYEYMNAQYINVVSDYVIEL